MTNTTLSKKEQLLEKYEELLKSLDININESGELTHAVTNVPVLMEGDDKTTKRLMFPTDEVLRNLTKMKDEVFVFHPLSENIYSSNSLVLLQLRYMIEARVHRLITIMGYVLVNAVLDNATSDSLTDNQLAQLAPIADVDTKFLKSYVELVDSLKVLEEPRLNSFFLKRGGTLNNIKYKRLTVVSFPLIKLVDDIDSNSGEPIINGIKFRKKDIGILKNLFAIIVPKATTEHAYSSGSNSNVAPSLECLLQSYSKLVRETSGLTWDFRAACKAHGINGLHVNKDTVSSIIGGATPLVDLISVIPALPGNTGEPIKDDATQSASARTAEVKAPAFINNPETPKLHHSGVSKTTEIEIAPQHPIRERRGRVPEPLTMAGLDSAPRPQRLRGQPAEFAPVENARSRIPRIVEDVQPQLLRGQPRQNAIPAQGIAPLRGQPRATSAIQPQRLRGQPRQEEFDDTLNSTFGRRNNW